MFERRVKLYSSFVRSGDLCFDVGANLGNRTEPLLAVGAKVVAIEPQAHCREQLHAKFGDRLTIVPLAVGSRVETRRFYRASNHVLSSFSESWIYAVQQYRFRQHTWKIAETVELTTLDLLIAEHGRPKFIKIDVEGYELEVLSGLSQPINMISYEYTVPEQPERALQCLELLAGLAARHSGDCLCNYSARETAEFGFEAWVRPDVMRATIASQAFALTGFGDIYVKAAC